MTKFIPLMIEKGGQSIRLCRKISESTLIADSKSWVLVNRVLALSRNARLLTLGQLQKALLCFFLASKGYGQRKNETPGFTFALSVSDRDSSGGLEGRHKVQCI